MRNVDDSMENTDKQIIVLNLTKDETIALEEELRSISCSYHIKKSNQSTRGGSGGSFEFSNLPLSAIVCVLQNLNSQDQRNVRLVNKPTYDVVQELLTKTPPKAYVARTKNILLYLLELSKIEDVKCLWFEFRTFSKPEVMLSLIVDKRLNYIKVAFSNYYVTRSLSLSQPNNIIIIISNVQSEIDGIKEINIKPDICETFIKRFEATIDEETPEDTYMKFTIEGDPNPAKISLKTKLIRIFYKNYKRKKELQQTKHVMPTVADAMSSLKNILASNPLDYGLQSTPLLQTQQTQKEPIQQQVAESIANPANVEVIQTLPQRNVEYVALLPTSILQRLIGYQVDADILRDILQMWDDEVREYIYSDLNYENIRNRYNHLMTHKNTYLTKLADTFENYAEDVELKNIEPLSQWMSEQLRNGGLTNIYKYKNRNYKVRIGSRGGKYILVKGKKHYI